MIQVLEKFFLQAGLSLAIVEDVGQNIPVEILAAIVAVESSGRPYAARYEKKYKWLYRPTHFARKNRVTKLTEMTMQKISYGPAQILGAVAREYNFDRALTEFAGKPVLSFTYACIYLRHLFQRYPNWPDAISAYNQGSPRRKFLTDRYRNQKYVDKVMNRAKELGYSFGDRRSS